MKASFIKLSITRTPKAGDYMDSVERSLESLKQRIVKLGIPQENEKAIMDFDTQCYINGLRPATRLCYMK